MIYWMTFWYARFLPASCQISHFRFLVFHSRSESYWHLGIFHMNTMKRVKDQLQFFGTKRPLICALVDVNIVQISTQIIVNEFQIGQIGWSSLRFCWMRLSSATFALWTVSQSLVYAYTKQLTSERSEHNLKTPAWNRPQTVVRLVYVNISPQMPLPFGFFNKDLTWESAGFSVLV